jgi:outer membrane cobalamin receptor
MSFVPPVLSTTAPRRTGRIAVEALSLSIALAWCSPGIAADAVSLEPIDVTAPRLGHADSAAEDVVPREQIHDRPVYRLGEVLENVPGLVVTQHSGEGKANQYFLRGFNLDHGTDLAITVDGVPVNLRTHAHGQGYSDLNFLIPELVSDLHYRKGPYYVDEGDFATAGAAHIGLARRLERGIAEAGIGSAGYRRTLLADSLQTGRGNLTYALDLMHNDGPWTVLDDYRKVNAVLRYSVGDERNGSSMTAMAYRGKWNSTDQVPKRAVGSGLIGRFDTIDATDGGEAHRYSLSARWRRADERSGTEASAYLVRSDLKLFSNFTFFLNDPANGDQFEQRDRRVLSGGNLKHTWLASWGQRRVENSVGAQMRNDNISLGLFDTAARRRLSTTRSDRVVETSAALYFENRVSWFDKLRTVAGLRGDYFRGEVRSDNAANSGKADDYLVSPKVSMVLGPWRATEYFVNYGRGFHSNDIRGATITLDPKTGDPAKQVPLLVRATGYEAGVRTAIVPRLQASVALFRLDLDSELVFVGDAGTTEAGRPSRRTGLDLSMLYASTSWLLLDADIAFSRARFSDSHSAGSRVPGAVEGVATFTAAVENFGRYYGSVRLRYFGPRALIEDNGVRSSSTTLLSGRIGYKLDKRMRVQLDVFNLLNRRVSQIDYFYESRLRGDAAPVADVHFHPAEPRSFRTSLVVSF